MKLKLAILLALLAAAIYPARAQNTVTITGTVEDSTPTVYANGHGTAQLVPTNVQWTINGVPVPALVNIGVLSATGTFSVALTNTSLLDQQASSPRWQFSFSSAPIWNYSQPYVGTQQVYSFTVPALALTSSQSLTSTIQAAASTENVQRSSPLRL